MGPILAASAVGTNPEIYPPGTAKLLRAGAVITLQIHYTPYGEETTDQIGVGGVDSYDFHVLEALQYRRESSARGSSGEGGVSPSVR